MALEDLSQVSRQDFIPKLLDGLDVLDPAVCINGDTSDQFPVADGRFLDIKSVLYKELVRRLQNESNKTGKGYDFVLEYDPAKNSVSFGDEVGGFKDEDRYMREGLISLDIRINDANNNNLVVPLLNPDIVKSVSGGMLPDKVFLQMIEKVIGEHGKKVCIIIDRANLFIHQEGKDTASSERIHNESIVIDLIQFLREHEGSHFILIDRKNVLNGELKQEIPFVEIPAVTRADIENLLKGVVNLEANPNIFNLCNGLSVKSIRRIISDTKKVGGDVEKAVIESFTKTRVKEMNAKLEGTAELFEVTFDKDQIYMPETIMNEIDLIIQELSSGSEFIHQGCILPGPPGTGKTAIAQYIAYKCKIPFFKLADIGGEGLRGNTELKLRKLKSVLSSNRPCILFVDEISDIWGKGSGEIRSNGDKDDAEVNRLLKEMLGSPEMKGVFIIGAANDLDKMDPAMYRRGGRLEDIIPILPPTTIEARKNTFIAIWNQFDSLKGVRLNEEFVDFVVTQGNFVEVKDSIGNTYGTYSEVTGADYKSIIQRAGRMSHGNGKSIQENILLVFQSIPLQKDNDFYNRIISSIKLGNRFDLLDKNEPSSNQNADINRAIALMGMQAKVDEATKGLETLKDQKLELAKQIQESREEYLRLIEELSQIQESLDSRVRMETKEERIRMARRIKEIRKRLGEKKHELNNREQGIKTKETELESRDNELIALQKQLLAQATEIVLYETLYKLHYKAKFMIIKTNKCYHEKQNNSGTITKTNSRRVVK